MSFGQNILTEHEKKFSHNKTITDQSELSVSPAGLKCKAAVFQGNERPRLSKEDIEKRVRGARFDDVSEHLLNSLCSFVNVLYFRHAND